MPLLFKFFEKDGVIMDVKGGNNMFYSRWENKSDIKNHLRKIDYRKNVEHSGLPLIYEGDSIYVTDGNSHSLIVGATGSGKTQTTILPLIKLSMLANESVVVNDPKGELYKSTANGFRKNGYNVIMLDFDNAIYGNYFNPLNLAYRLYKEKSKDKCINVIEEIGYYLFTDLNDKSDPFWVNSTIDYFTGLCLYLFENTESEVNLNDIFNLANKLNDDKESDKFLKEIGKNNAIYYNVSGTLTAPADTKGGIVATFNQKLKKYVSKEKLSSMMSKTDFDISAIANEKVAIYIVSGYYDYSNSLIPLFINQMFEVVNIYGNYTKRVNIILDEFDSLLPIKNFAEIINYARGIGINFTCVIQSVVNLANTYGKENLTLLKLCFPNIVFLYANDSYTLEAFSNLCGNESEKKPLISVEELKIMQKFEAIFLIPRVMPFRAKLIPDYKINWNIDFEEANFELRK